MSDLEREPLFFPGDEIHQARVERVAAALRRHDLAGLLLLKHDAVRYVTGFYAKGYRPFIDFDYAALVQRDEDTVLGYTVGGEERRIDLRSRVSASVRLPSFPRWGAGLADMLRRSGLTTGRLGFDILPHFIYEELRAVFPNLELVDASGIWADLTAVKHPLEIPMIEQALRIAEAGVAAAMEAIRPGVTEIEVSAAAECTMRAMGSEMNPFIPVVATSTPLIRPATTPSSTVTNMARRIGNLQPSIINPNETAISPPNAPTDRLSSPTDNVIIWVNPTMIATANPLSKTYRFCSVRKSGYRKAMIAAPATTAPSNPSHSTCKSRFISPGTPSSRPLVRATGPAPRLPAARSPERAEPRSCLPA